MKHGRALAVSAAGASLAAVVAFASPTLATTTTTTTTNPPSSCSYPPVRTPALTLASTVSSVKPRVNFQLTGTLKVNSCGLKNWNIGLYTSLSPTGPFVLIATTKTNNSGVYAFNQTLLVTRYYRTASGASGGYNSALSNVVKVTKK